MHSLDFEIINKLLLIILLFNCSNILIFSILQQFNSNIFKFLNAISVSKFIFSSIIIFEKFIYSTSERISSFFKNVKSSNSNNIFLFILLNSILHKYLLFLNDNDIFNDNTLRPTAKGNL